MSSRIWAAFRKALTVDRIVQSLVSLGLATIVAALLGGLLQLRVEYVGVLGLGIFVLLLAFIVGINRERRRGRRYGRGDEEPPLPEPPIEPQGTEWEPLVMSTWGDEISLRIESYDGTRARNFGCEVADPSGAWAAAGMGEGNSEPRAWAEVQYPKDFPTAPRLPLQDGLYRVRWFRSGPGKRPLADSYFRIKHGELERE